jgi:hypothetical protein
MTQQKQATVTKPDPKNRPKVEPAIVSDPMGEMMSGTQLPAGPLGAAGDGAVDAQAARLGDPRFQTVQRQVLAAQIGQLQGNHHLQMLMTSLNQGNGASNGPAPAHNGHGAGNRVATKKSAQSTPAATGRKTDLVEATEAEVSAEGLGSSGPPTLAIAEPPPNGKGANGTGYRVQRQAANMVEQPGQADQTAIVEKNKATQQTDTPNGHGIQSAATMPIQREAEAGRGETQPKAELSWGERAKKWLFEKALSAAGVDKEQVMGLVEKAGPAIAEIFSHPGRFVNTLIQAIGQGFTQFKDNIGKHLKAGLMSWLFGAMTQAGIQLPQEFSLKSILSLVLQVLGITVERIREKVAKLIGEKNVQRLEKVWQILSTFMKEGLGGLWEMLKDYLGDLKAMVIDEIKNWIISQIIQAAVLKILSMFNPVSGLITIIKTIYNVVKFLIERASQIAALFQAIAGSVVELATGNIAKAANKVEEALARLIPIAIGFLASLLGISGITDKIKEIIKRIQSKVEQAIDKLIQKIVGGIKKLFGKGKGKEGETPKSAMVKQKARAEVVAHSAQPFKDPGEAKTFISGILNRLRPEGLKSLDLRPKKGKPGQFDVIAIASPTDDVGDVRVNAEGDLATEVSLLFEEVQRQLHGEAQEQALIIQQEPETRLSPSSGSLNQRILERYIDSSNAGVVDKAKAKTIVSQKIAAALRAKKGDKIFDLLRTAQAAVNRLIKGGQVTIEWKKQLQTHHVPEVHEHPGTFPKEFRSRIEIPEKWQKAIEEWANQLVGMSQKERTRRRRELAKHVRDSLTEKKMETTTKQGKMRSKAVLEEVEMIVTTAELHSEHHHQENETGSTSED